MTDYVPSNFDLAISLISYTTVNGVLYTFAFILYCLCARLSYSQLDGKINRQTVSTFALASVMIICATMNMALNNQYARIIYVDYNTLPGGPLGLLAQNHASTSLQINSIASLTEAFVAMGVLLRRVWIIYSGIPSRFSIPIIILASLFYLAYVVSTILQTEYAWAPLSATLPKTTRTLDTVTVMALLLGVASTVIMTLMIATRLMLIRRKHIKLMGKTEIAAQYLGIVAMLIESYALNTAWNISYIVAYILKNPPAHNFLSLSALQIEVISYFLLLYRVLSGRAWDRQTRSRLSTLQWQHHDIIQPTGDSTGTEIVNINANYIEPNPPTFSSLTKV